MQSYISLRPNMLLSIFASKKKKGEEHPYALLCSH
nr:MAG TPA: hypothetical protein [Bacteriophage sp.]